VVVPWDVKLMHMVGSFMFACLTVGVVFTVFWAAVHMPVFNLVGITVEGEVDHNNATTLRANVTTRMTGNFFTADLSQVRHAFEGVPWVRLATVQREFPNRFARDIARASPSRVLGRRKRIPFTQYVRGSVRSQFGRFRKRKNSSPQRARQ